MKNIKEYGVIADAQTIQTTAVQSAIDDCAKNGKTLVFEKGKAIGAVCEEEEQKTFYKNYTSGHWKRGVH